MKSGLNNKMGGMKWALGLERLILYLAVRSERCFYNFNVKIGGIEWTLVLGRIMLNLAVRTEEENWKF